MKQITIDCAAIDSRDTFHDILAQALSLPEWYGRNLDALHDLLAATTGETVLTFSEWLHAEEVLGRYALMAKKAMTHAASKNSNLNIEFL